MKFTSIVVLATTLVSDISASNALLSKDRSADRMRIIKTLANNRPGEVSTKDILLADYN
jgi:hypothetical protein